MRFSSQEKFILAQEQLLGLLELTESRGLHPDKLLRGSGLFSQDLQAGQIPASAAQLQRLFDNAERLLPKDCSFLFGQYLLPGAQAELSRALLAAPNAGEALSLLAEYSSLVMPLNELSLHYDQRDCFIQLHSFNGDDYGQRFALEAAMAAIVSLCRWLGGAPLQWRFLLAHERPKYVEQYQVHLGGELNFNTHINALVLSRAQLTQVWPRGSVARLQAARLQLERLAVPQSLAAWAYWQLRQRLQQPPSLEQLAEQQGVSVATLKRKLKAQGCSYQQLLDNARRHLAIYHLRSGALGVEQLAAKLHYHDKHNFKRSFKRWTGLTPAAYCEA
ncbi:MAG: AraC family transcriptional regulator [Cellvibrionaceae bacterium]|nr:AraC family transcriptional regulator [Cellvibrionaceae bacterium]